MSPQPITPQDIPEVEPDIRLRRFKAVLDRIDFREGYEIITGLDATGAWYCVKHWRPDSTTGVEGFGYGSRYPIQSYWTTSDTVRHIFKAYKDYIEHELREFFLYRGERVFGPHIDLDLLAFHLMDVNAPVAPTAP